MPDHASFQSSQKPRLLLVEKDVPDLPGIDLQATVARMGGNLEACLHLLKLFPCHHGDDVAKIQAACLAENYEDASRLAHKLRGSAILLGFTSLIANSEKLEQCLIERNLAATPTLLANIDHEMRTMIRAIAEL